MVIDKYGGMAIMGWYGKEESERDNREDSTG